jgi:hypothetical protein
MATKIVSSHALAEGGFRSVSDICLPKKCGRFNNWLVVRLMQYNSCKHCVYLKFEVMWYMVYGIWYMVYGIWYMLIHGLDVVYGLWTMVIWSCEYVIIIFMNMWLCDFVIFIFILFLMMLVVIVGISIGRPTSFISKLTIDVSPTHLSGHSGLLGPLQRRRLPAQDPAGEGTHPPFMPLWSGYS